MKTEIILICLSIGHFLGDYTHLSTNWMLSAKRYGKPLSPILCHALVHTIFVQIVLIFFINDWSRILISMLFMLITHFSIDVVKGRINKYFPSVQQPSNKIHWYIFGADQLLHFIVIIIIVFNIINY